MIYNKINIKIKGNMKINTVTKLNDTTVEVYKPTVEGEKLRYFHYFDTTLFSFLTYNQKRVKEDILYLRELNKEDEKNAKKWKREHLIGATVSATFNNRRIVGDVKEKSGWICIDIDKDDNTNFDADKAKRDVMRLPYVALTELSCRGEGIWCLIPYNKDNYIGYVFNSLKDDFKQIGYNIDKNCSDITRLRFVSYDDNMLLKKECEEYDKIKIDECTERYVEGDEWKLTKEDLKEIVIIIYVLVHFHNYHKDDYDEWLLDGFRLATIPNKDVGLKLFQMISENSDNYKGIEDVKNKFNECCKTTRYKTNILGYYYNLIKGIYSDSWKFRVNELLKEKSISTH